jgi:hypothetical protein
MSKQPNPHLVVFATTYHNSCLSNSRLRHSNNPKDQQRKGNSKSQNHFHDNSRDKRKDIPTMIDGTIEREANGLVLCMPGLQFYSQASPIH